MKQKKTSRLPQQSVSQGMINRHRNASIFADNDNYLLEEYLGIALPKSSRQIRKRK